MMLLISSRSATQPGLPEPSGHAKQVEGRGSSPFLMLLLQHAVWGRHANDTSNNENRRTLKGAAFLLYFKFLESSTLQTQGGSRCNLVVTSTPSSSRATTTHLHLVWRGCILLPPSLCTPNMHPLSPRTSESNVSTVNVHPPYFKR